jgi:poly-gamma-glutamate capsule biosynthesis protein CapA/YwtB (metallophosphatase superfamily)
VIRTVTRARLAATLGVALLLAVTACTSGSPSAPVTQTRTVIVTASPSSRSASSAPAASSSAPSSPSRPPGEFTFAFAGDVNFMDRTATRLAANPATVFGVAQPVISAADLSMVNLETAIATTDADKQDKEFNFRAPPSALTALRDAGVDVATMANNHGADYGQAGLSETLAAISSSKFPVVGIGANATQAYAPWTTTVNGVKVAVLAADQVQDETTLRDFTAGPNSAGVASAYSPQLITAVQAAKAAGYVVVVYVHWGVEYTTCPDSDQENLAQQLSQAGASAVIGTHPHVLQGGGWLADGTYVEYSTGNYLWWESFGNNQDDNGVFTLTFRNGKVVDDTFHPSHLDSTGVPVPATGAEATRITDEWNSDRSCTNLTAQPPA